MKFILALILSLGAFSCTSEKEIQANIVNVQLVRIDTVSRFPNALQKLLIWRSEQNIDYITFEPLNSQFRLGTRMKVMVTK
ncbi:MAG: hypothetical protein ACJ75B_12130 [Flavisolibacter sp.]|jgi:hypothetical protein